MARSEYLKTLLRSSCAVGLLLCGNLPAHAQTADAAQADDQGQEGRLEEIVVTAQKQKESLQRTPISITALTSKALEEQGVRNIGDVAGTVPNLSVNSGPQGSSDANFAIRGVGQFDFIITTDPGVGVYVDGVYLGRTVGALLDSGDIERIEVLRGPQGTLFGRNTLGGAVSVISLEPDTDEFSGNARATIGSRDRIDVEVGLNVPFTDQVAGRFYAFTRNQDGATRRIGDGAQFGTVDRLGARGAIKAELSDTFSITVRGDYLRDRGTTQAMIRSGERARPGLIPNDFPTERPSRFYETFQSNDPDQRNDIWGLSATAELELGSALVRSITAYRHLKGISTFDADGSRYLLADQVSNIKQDQVSQELQFLGKAFDDRLSYLVGGYFFQEEARQVQRLCLPEFVPVVEQITSQPFQRFQACGYWNQDNDQRTRAYAVFGQLSYAFTDALKLTLGGRYSWENKRLTNTTDFRLPDNSILAPIITGVTDTLSFEKFTPKVTLEYQATEDVLAYISYSKGFRSGGFNGRIIVPTPDARLPAFGPDVNDTYEVGVKTQLLDGRVRFNLTGYYSKYKDTQQTVIDPVVQFRLANAGDARIWGLEAELNTAPIDNLRIDASVGYTNSELTRIDPALAFTGVAVGNQMPFNPEWTLSTGIQYEFELGESGTITPRIDARYQSKVTFETLNSSFSSQKGYETIDARLTWRNATRNLNLSLFGKNLTDSKYYSFGQDARAVQGVAFLIVGSRPREWGLTAALEF